MLGGVKRDIVRTEKWRLGVTSRQRAFARLTTREYQAYCRALTGVVMTHWVEIAVAKGRCAVVERLTHATSLNPTPRYGYFSRRFYKFPSYLRRAAIEFVLGQVSSFLTRYDAWQSGQRPHRNARPPRLEVGAGAHPTLYRGQMMKWHDGFVAVEVKLFDGREWLWHLVPVRKRGKRDPNGSKLLNPMLLTSGRKAWLAVPHQFARPTSPKWADSAADKVLGVDLGINKAATVAVVGRDGTVTYRGFIHPGVDMDRRDKSFDAIRKRATLTGVAGKGFCRRLYRRAASHNTEIARFVARSIMDVALTRGVWVIAFEHLKGFRPTGGRYRGSLRKRFHGWVHRQVYDIVVSQAEEAGIRVVTVSARGTSKYAFDGSGPVVRDKRNAALAAFATGKRYDADLNAAYNVAAKHHYFRYWRHKLGLDKPPSIGGQGNRDEARTGRSSGRAPRTPVTLSTLWVCARRMVEDEAPRTLAVAS